MQENLVVQLQAETRDTRTNQSLRNKMKVKQTGGIKTSHVDRRFPGRYWAFYSNYIWFSIFRSKSFTGQTWFFLLHCPFSPLLDMTKGRDGSIQKRRGYSLPPDLFADTGSSSLWITGNKCHSLLDNFELQGSQEPPLHYDFPYTSWVESYKVP